MSKKSSKESTSRLFNRYLWLVDLIYRKERVSFEEISNKWNTSSLNISGEDIPLRTFHNHRKAIEQMFDINIECDKRNGYVYYIENYDDMERGGVRQWLVNTFAVNNIINESKKLKHRILFEQIPSGQKFLTQIIEAMGSGVSLEMTYHSFWSNNESTFIIEPYCVKVFKQRWYVVGRSLYSDEQRIYSLDRINKLATTDQSYILPDDFDAKELFWDSYGVIISDDYIVEQSTIKIYGNQVKYIESLPIHHSQKVIEHGDGYAIFSYYIKPNYEFRQELLSHGDSVEVLSPEWLRNEMKNIAEKQLAKYID